MRKYTNKILELLEEGYFDKDVLIRDLLNWMSESDVQEFFEQRIEFDNDFFGEDEEG